MEQGGSASTNSESINPSNQEKHSFTDELRAIVNSASHDFPVENHQPIYGVPETSEFPTSNFDGAQNYSQNEQSQQIGGGPSFSTDLSQIHAKGEMLLSQIHAAYARGNSESRDNQLYQGNNAMISGEESNYNEMMNNRHNNINLSAVSNMAHQFPLSTSSSAHGGLQIGSSQTLVPFESSMIDSSVNNSMYNAYLAAQAQNNPIAPDNLVSSRLMRSQGLPYQMNAPNGFDPGVDISNNAKTPTSTLMAPFERSMNDPLIDAATQQAQNNATIVESSFPLRSVRGQGINPYPMNTPSSFELGSGSTSNGYTLKRKMPSQDDITQNYQSWNSFGRGLHRYSSSSYDGGRYTLYDKRYEDVGLPVDPHLRIFIAGNGNGESSSRRRD